ncbi:MAG: nicotinate (nicotinamide) nucleotide adenylyltransferase [Planctomycetota bacterium]|jgi:nicotinate-nucleotide adenylyltransferase
MARTPPSAGADSLRSDSLRSDSLALYGGVFDPIHRGHLAVARAALAALPVDRITLLPSGDPPHKTDRSPAAAADRLALIGRALAGDPAFRVDGRELERSGPSYTVETLRELRGEAPERAILFLIGADNARSIGTWYAAEELFSLCDPVLVSRPGDRPRFTATDLPFLDAGRIEALNALAIDGVEVPWSSREIRARIAAGATREELEQWVPAAVAEEIIARGLYRGASA